MASVEFPCGCACDKGLQRGELLLFTALCAGHQAAHADGLVMDNSNFLGCDCPGCEFGRYAGSRERMQNAWPDNWRFLARLSARRRRDALPRPRPA